MITDDPLLLLPTEDPATCTCRSMLMEVDTSPVDWDSWFTTKAWSEWQAEGRKWAVGKHHPRCHMREATNA